MISMGWNFVSSLKIESPLKIKVNGIGSSDERKTFKEKLKQMKILVDEASKES